MDKVDLAITEFWHWFEMNCDGLSSVKSSADRVLEDLLHHLHVVHPELYFEVGVDGEKKELIITAEGKIRLFGLAEKIVRQAPSMDQWKVTALKPPMGFDFSTCYEGVQLSPRDMWFLPLERRSSPSWLGLRVGVPLEEVTEGVKNAVLVILDTGIGERSAALDIHYFEVQSLPASPADSGYIEFPELADYISWRKARISSDGPTSAELK